MSKRTKPEEPVTPEQAFAMVIRKRRLELGLLQLDLAASNELDPSYVSKLELGKRQPSLRTILLLAKLLKTTPGALLDPVAEMIGKSKT
ncbi:MAG: helix-turn-helix domain-containing protein [Candidatus Kapaibacterium sp.]